MQIQLRLLLRTLRIFSLAALVTAVAINLGCGGSSASSSAHTMGDPLHLGASPGPLGSTTPAEIQLRLGSEPDDRIASLALEIDSLQVTNSGNGNIDLLQSPVTFEFTQNAIITAPVANLSIYQDTYSALVFPAMTGEVVFYDVNGLPIQQSFTVPAQSVPVNFVLGADPIVLNVFLDLSQSFSITDSGGSGIRRTRNRMSPDITDPQSIFSVNPLTVNSQYGAPNPVVGQPESGSISFFVGTATSVNTQTQVVTLQPSSGDSVQVYYGTNGSTNFVGCSPSTVAGMLVEMEGYTQNDGSIFATEVEGINPTSFTEIYGQLNGYAPEGEYYNMILEGGDGANLTSSLVGSNVTVDWGLANYDVNTGNLDMSGSQDLVFDESHVFPGQLVELENDTLAVPDPNSTNAAYFEPLMFELEQQTITGVVSGYSYNSQSQTGSFTLTVASNATLRAMNPGLTTVTVRQIPQTYLRNISSIKNGATLKVRGLMFVDPNCSNANYEADRSRPVDFIIVASRVSQ